MKLIRAAVISLTIAATVCVAGASALEVYIPHISSGAEDWTDYLQVNNTDAFASSYTLTLYGSGQVVYSQQATVPALSRAIVELKSLETTGSPGTGVITYNNAGLHFKFSTEHDGGGLAELMLSDSLGSSIAFQYSDFTSSIVTKGAVVANFSSADAPVTLYALGGGSVFGKYTATIKPYGKLLGTHAAWFPGVPFASLEQIVLVSASETLSGFVICSDSTLAHLLFAPAGMVTGFDTVNADSLIGLPQCIDGDSDGYYSSAGCGTLVDCNDSDGTIFPGAAETCGGGIDQDCSGADTACSPVGGIPDLVITNMQEISLPTGLGETLSIEFDIENQGQGICMNGSFAYSLCHLTTPGGIVEIESKELIGSGAVLNLPAGQARHMLYTYVIPAETEPDDYWLLIEVSEGGNFLGVDGNNEYSVDFSVGAPDLIIETSTFESEPSGPGDLLRFRYTILNQGVKSSPKLNITYSIQARGSEEIGTDTMGSLAAGNSITKSVSHTIEPGHPTGDYQLVITLSSEEGSFVTKEFRFDFDI